MISDELRKKLEEMNRGPLGAQKPPGGRAAPAKAERARIEDVVKGRVIGDPERPCFLVERALEELFGRERAGAFEREFADVWAKGRYVLSGADRERDWPAIVEAPPTRLLFLDIETLGLASTPVFLVGVMQFDPDNRFRLRQFFARDYAEERHVLAHVAEVLPSFARLVTFNGKSFDWPYLRDRAVYHAVRLAGEPANLDLLHESRRRWKTILPNCQLQTLEYHISRRRRTGDIPGNLIPEAYHRYVRTGQARAMADVIHHNALDLITMAELMLFMLQGGELAWE